MKKSKPAVIQRTTLRLPPEIWREAKIAAIRQNMSLTDFVADAVRRAVDDVNRKRNQA
jgi:predicted HicB family RNase H-like nuclease